LKGLFRELRLEGTMRFGARLRETISHFFDDRTSEQVLASPMKNIACPFCNAGGLEEMVDSFESVLAIRDQNPVTMGHLLVIPRRHTEDFFTMSSKEREDALTLMDDLKQQTLRSDPSVLGFNIGINCGRIAGQTIPHAHIHLIPRRKGDTDDPRGGVRGVIPSKMKY
jgi:diadenosine tetraphosphate (Ap4A) HIT family hydrolase